MRSFGTPRLLLQMDLEFADGHKQQIVSDESWKLTDKGPIRANNEFDGEEYDARMEIAGWASPGFKARGLDGGADGRGAHGQDGGADGRAAAGHRDHPSGEVLGEQAGRLHLGHGPEHGRMVPADGNRPGGYARRLAARRDPECRWQAVCR